MMIQLTTEVLEIEQEITAGLELLQEMEVRLKQSNGTDYQGHHNLE